jgi:hypothetical protein
MREYIYPQKERYKDWGVDNHVDNILQSDVKNKDLPFSFALSSKRNG